MHPLPSTHSNPRLPEGGQEFSMNHRMCAVYAPGTTLIREQRECSPDVSQGPTCKDNSPRPATPQGQATKINAQPPPPVSPQWPCARTWFGGLQRTQVVQVLRSRPVCTSHPVETRAPEWPHRTTPLALPVLRARQPPRNACGVTPVSSPQHTGTTPLHL